MSNRRSWEAVRARLAREQTILILLVVAYVVTGKLGLTFAFIHPAATLIWPPAGIAVGATVLLGYRIWPVVFAGGIVLYLTTLGPTIATAAMAAGNSVETLLAAYLVNRYAGGRQALQNPRNSLRFAGVLLLSSMSVSATCTAASLCLTGLVSWTDYGSLWLTQGLGSFTGMLLVAPPIILYSQGSVERWKPVQLIEGLGVLAALIVVGLVVFFNLPVAAPGVPVEYLCGPVLLWAACRLGRRAAAAALLVLTGLAIIGTLNGFGPFVRSTPTASLAIVQLFLGLSAVMTFALVALASEYSVAEAQLRELVVTDPLTGLPNYRRLLEVLGAEIARANRIERPFAVVFFDMDGLKRINDEMGHLTGSRAVCRFAETLRASCRTTDTAARYGGDEFVAVLADTDHEGAALVIRRVAERLAEDPDKPALAVSAGIAVYPRDGGTPTTLLSAADRALYTVKAEKASARRRGIVGLREWSSFGTS